MRLPSFLAFAFVPALVLAVARPAAAQTCQFSPYVDCGDGTCCPGGDVCCAGTNQCCSADLPYCCPGGTECASDETGCSGSSSGDDTGGSTDTDAGTGTTGGTGGDTSYGGNGGHIGGACPGYSADGTTFNADGVCDTGEFCCPRLGLDSTGNSGYCCPQSDVCCPTACSSDGSCGGGTGTSPSSAPTSSSGGCVVVPGSAPLSGDLFGIGLAVAAVATTRRRRGTK